MTAPSKIRIRSRRNSTNVVCEQDFQNNGVLKSNRSECTYQPALGESFLESCQRHHDRIAVTYGVRAYRYEWLAKKAFEFSTAISSVALFKRGDHVGLFFERSIEYIVSFYGTILAGGVCVPIPQYHSKDSLEKLSVLADVKFLVDSNNSPSADQTNFDVEQSFDLNAQPTVSKIECPNLKSDPDALAMMLFTSGSTGEPRAVMLSHRNILANRNSIQGYLPITCEDKALAVVPFSHALGNSVLQTHLLAGAQLVLNDDLKFPSSIVSALRDSKCTSVSAVPEFFEALTPSLEHQPKLTSLKYVAVAGGKMNPTCAKKLNQAIGRAELFLMYGQTEATARLAYLPPCHLEDAIDTIGIPIPGVELELFDDENSEVHVGEIGSLHARGKNIMLGYWNDPENTQRVIKNGWLDTGDLARRHENGRIEICGRKNGIVKIQGFRFHPVEIEKQLSHLLPDVSTIAIEFDFYGKSRIALFARATTNQSITKMILSRCCRQHLPSHMVPQRFEIIKKWPLNANGKIDRLSLKKSLATQFSKTTVHSQRKPILAST